MSTSILIVDDSVAIRESVRFILERKGYTVFAASDGVEGLQALHDQRIELVLTDMNMPRMDGITMIHRIRGYPNNNAVPIIALATLAEERIAEEAKQAGAAEWISKPFTLDRLLLAIEDTLQAVS